MLGNDPKLEKKAIKDGGFYDENHIWNSIKTFPNDDHLYRERVETLIIRNGKEVFVKKRPDGTYSLPGGSSDKGKSLAKQAIAECQEETHMDVKNIQDTKLTYKTYFGKEKLDGGWVKNMPVKWNATYTHIFYAEYDGKTDRKIDKEDEDPYIRSGRWYSIHDCYKFFSKIHISALYVYQKAVKESAEEVTEGYIPTYFKNRKFLKQVSANPEIERKAITMLIKNARKVYTDNKNTSKVKRVLKDEEKAKGFFYPVNTLEFPDGCSATVVVCFCDDPDTPACAVDTEEYGNLVVLYPDFFKKQPETQIFTMLHEIGHIRLTHTDVANMHKKIPIFGEVDTDEHRIKRMMHGKVTYQEMYADLYAILNGAKLYSILGVGPKIDTDEIYDYRLTNAELANRYNLAYKNSQKFSRAFENGYESEDVEDEPEVSHVRPQITYEELAQKTILQSYGDVEVIFEEKYEDCPDQYFGILQTRSFPLNTKKRVYSACKLFGHAPDQYKKQLARNIFRAMQRYDIPKDYIGPKSKLYQYIQYW